MTTRLQCLTLAKFAFAVLWPGLSWGHGGTPRVVQISFPAQLDGDYWAVTDNQGLYAEAGGTINWLCEDAVARNAGFRDVVLTSEGTQSWLVATNLGLYRSSDGGCNFTPCRGPVETQVPIGLWQNPVRREESLTATQTPGTPNDVYLTEDGGATWHGAGLAIDGITHDVLRAPARPERVYVAHARAAIRSDDGGRTFVEISLGPPELDVLAEEFRLLAGHPTRPDEVWATVERFPDSTVMRSQDAGETWTPMFTLADTPGALVFDREAGRALVISRFDEYRRSEDGGETWTRAPEAVPLLGCLTLQPGTQRLWGCSNVFFMGPWVLGYSDDFGATWSPALERFTDVRAQWGCAPDAEASLACEGLCPGQAAGAICDSADAGTSPTPDAAARGLDLGPLGPLDAEVPGPLGEDADRVGVPGAGADATVTPPVVEGAGDSAGCGVAPSSRAIGGRLVLTVAGLGAWVVRRRARRGA